MQYCESPIRYRCKCTDPIICRLKHLNFTTRRLHSTRVYLRREKTGWDDGAWERTCMWKWTMLKVSLRTRVLSDSRAQLAIRTFAEKMWPPSTKYDSEDVLCPWFMCAGALLDIRGKMRVKVRVFVSLVCCLRYGIAEDIDRTPTIGMKWTRCYDDFNRAQVIYLKRYKHLDNLLEQWTQSHNVSININFVCFKLTFVTFPQLILLPNIYW